MANSAGIYLELDGKILLLCDERWGPVPNGIAIAEFTDFANRLALKAGTEVFCRDGRLHFGANWITIAQTEKPEPDWGHRICRERWQEGIRSLRGRKKGLAPLAEPLLEGKAAPDNNPLCALALPRLEKLMQSLRKGDGSALEEAVTSLLGLGPGLTPSGDDVLCGLLWGLNHSPYGNHGLKAILCREAGKRTHPVSAAYLTAIAEGEVFGRLAEAWSGLTGREESNFERLLEVGSSSGGDLLLGLLLAGKLCMEREE